MSLPPVPPKAKEKAKAIARRAAWLVPVLAAAGLGLSWAAAALRVEAELDRAEAELSARRFEEARGRLSRLSARFPDRADIAFALGASEAGLGRVDAALDAWARVPEDSGLSPRAALERARLALEHGRLSAAEQSLALLVDRRDAIGEEAIRLVQQLLLFSGRSDALPESFRRQWPTALRDGPAAAAGLLRSHWLAETQALPIDAVSEAIDRSHREAPDDDRVWLGLADLSRRAGRLDEADRWLDRCEARRPDDPDVARARLEWALAADRPGSAAEALARIPADRLDPAGVCSIRARLAALRGDADAERAALERLVALRPGDAASWARLGDLAAQAGLAGLRDRCRARKAEIDRLTDDYTRLMGEVAAGGRPPARALARLAEALGRRFEAIGWWTLLALDDRGDPEARQALDRLDDSPAPPAADPGRSLAELIPEAIPSASSPEPAGTTGPVPIFRDDAEAAGLHFVYDNDQSPSRRLPETMGGGLALLDFDGDGWLDVYCVQGGRFPGGSPGPGGGDRLFRNRGDGTFEDASESSGIASFPRGFGHGVAVGDIDNDGHPDLFVTRWRSYALYRNRGDGTFEDRTEAAGLGGDRGWPTSAAFADLDNDGDLDLYVCQYLRWDPDRDPPCPDPDRPGRFMYCVPRRFEAEPDRVFRNDGGVFVDVTESAGIVDRDGRGLGVVAADVNADGRIDLFVANDMTADLLFLNRGSFRFEESGELAGVASNAAGGYQAGMGVCCGDLDGDARPELLVTNFYGESTSLYRNVGGGQFSYASLDAGLAAPTRFVLGFGVALLDANLDGLLDLAQANGHVNDFRPGTPYAMPAQLFLGRGNGRFVEVTDRAGDGWSVDRVARGLATGDLNNDGLPDILILAQAGPLAFLRNLGPGGNPSDAGTGRFLTLRLEGTRSNRDGVGAVVVVTADGRTQTLCRVGGGSFLSANDGRLLVGLGAGADLTAVAVEVRWPSGQVDRFENLSPNASYRLVEGSPTARPLEGGPRPPGPPPE
ncbi:FG-GAP-like repeat-containing protein [Tautonia sociabilis]|uniref:Thioredoxin n=1 Tax=Tautonia sociabilis TaxID=2080755 RepID=A0A432MNW7_9BACT|nr:FG-GAP-like repeat-containing protein [Tautonia sociabilis]RUL89131.1 thioredoxin [Tautonia sociabilis]